jgi:predicted RNase H-like HicB family nuclease
MTYYIGLVHKETGSAFGVQFPDVPGCFSASDDMDHVMSNATEALSLWAEDMTRELCRPTFRWSVACSRPSIRLQSGASSHALRFLHRRREMRLTDRTT